MGCRVLAKVQGKRSRHLCIRFGGERYRAVLDAVARVPEEPRTNNSPVVRAYYVGVAAKQPAVGAAARGYPLDELT